MTPLTRAIAADHGAHPGDAATPPRRRWSRAARDAAMFAAGIVAAVLVGGVW